MVGSATVRPGCGAAVSLGVGHFVYEGDQLETGAASEVSILFADGTTFQLYASASVVLDSFVYGAGESSPSALVRVIKGKFGFLAGKIATAGRLIVETPLATIRTVRPATDAGGLAFLFLLCLIEDLHASSEDIVLIDDGTITYKDLTHGVFEILTKGQNPELIVVDDPAKTIVLQLHASGVSFSQIVNNPLQMTELQNFYKSAYQTYSQGLQDPFLQQLQHGPTEHAGSSTAPDLSVPSLASLVFPTVFVQPVVLQSHTSSNTNNGSGGNGQSFFAVPPVITVLPISVDEHAPIYIGPPTPQHPNVALVSIELTSPDTLVSVVIGNLPAGASIIDGHGHTYEGGADIIIKAADYESGVTLKSDVDVPPGTLLSITANVSGPGNTTASSTVFMPLTVDLDTTAQVHWINPNGGDWNDPLNWQNGDQNAVPIPFQDVVIDLAGPYTITSSGDVSIDSLRISSAASNVTIDIAGGTFAITTADTDPLDNAGTIVIDSGATMDVGSAGFPNTGVNTGTLHVNGGTLKFTDLALDNTSGLVQIDLDSTLNLQASMIDHGTVINHGLLEATAGTTNAIENLTSFSNDGELLVTNAGTKLTLSNDTLSNFIGTQGGTIQVDGTANGGSVTAANSATLELENTTIDGGGIATLAVFNVDGLLLAADDSSNAGTSNLIENFTTFSSDGEILVTGSSDATSLTLKNDTLTDFVGSQGGKIQVDGAHDGSGTGSTLTLENTTIDGGDAIARPAVFNVDGLLEVACSATNTIENFTAGNFTNDGKLWVTNAGTKLTLSNDTLNDYDDGATPTKGGFIQIDGLGTGSAIDPSTSSTLELRNTTIDGKNLGSLNNDGLLEVTNTDSDAATPANVIENFGAGKFSNDGKLWVTNAGTKLTLSNDTLNDYDDGATPTKGGFIQVDGTMDGSAVDPATSSTLELRNTTIDGKNLGSLNNDGLLEVTNTDSNVATPANIIENFGVGDFTNDGEILVTSDSGLLLKNDVLDDSNGTIQIDDGSTLTLDGAVIHGGTLNVGDEANTGGPTGGTIHVTGNSTIDDGAQFNDGKVDVDANVTLTLNDVTLNGTTIDPPPGSPATLQVDQGHDLTLTNEAAITGIAVANAGTVEIAGPASLGSDTVDNTAGIIQVDDTKTLTVSGATISGGQIELGRTVLALDLAKGNEPPLIDSTGKVLFAGGSIVALHSNDTFTLTVSVSDGTLLPANQSGMGSATLQIIGTLAEIDAALQTGVIYTPDVPSASYQDTIILTLTDQHGDTATHSNGFQFTYNSGDPNNSTLSTTDSTGTGRYESGLVDIATSSTINDDATISSGAIKVESTAILTLDNVTVDGTAITDDGGITLQDNFILKDGASVAGSGGVTTDVTNQGTLEAANGGAALTNVVVDNTSGTIQVDGGDTLTLSGATIDGGTINDFDASGGGTVLVTVASEIAGTSSAEVGLNGNGLGTVTLDAALTLDYVSLNNITIKNGPLTIDHVVEMAGPVTLLDDTVTNTGATLQIDQMQTLTIDGTTINGGTIDASADGALVALSNATLSDVTLHATNGVSAGLFETVTAGSTTILSGSTDNTPTLITGPFDVNADTTLELQGYIQDAGSLAVLGGAAGHAATVLIDGTVTLFGLGSLGLQGGQSVITGDSGTAKLVIENDTVDGTGFIGNGQLNIDVQAGGEIASNLSGTGITIDTGAAETFTNEGEIISNGSGGMVIVHDLVNTAVRDFNDPQSSVGLEASAGTFEIRGNVTGGGSAIISGGTLAFDAASDNDVTFTAAAGVLVLGDPADFSGSISGFGNGDTIDLNHLTFGAADHVVWTQTSSANGGSGTLEIEDASNVVRQSLNLNGTYQSGDFALASDGSTVNGGNPGEDVVFNNPPVVQLNILAFQADNTTSAPSDGTPIAVFRDVSITDPDVGASIHSAAVTLQSDGGSTDFANETIFVDTSLLTGATSGDFGASGTWGDLSWVTASGSSGLTLDVTSGSSDSDAVYQQFLDAIRFSTTSSSDSEFTATVTVNDRWIDSAPATQTILVGYSPPGELVVNGGFELNFKDASGATHFNNWTLANAAGNQSLSDGPAHGGIYDAAIGASDPGNPVTLSQTISTSDNADYTLSFWLSKGDDTDVNQFIATWGGQAVLTLNDEPLSSGYTHYVFDVLGDANQTLLQFSSFNSTDYWRVDDVSVRAGSSTDEQEVATGNVLFTDTNGPHTADETPDGASYVGEFTVGTPTEPNSPASGSVGWHFNLSNAELDNIAPNSVVTQSYDVTVKDAGNNSVTTQTVSVSVGGTGNDIFHFDAGTLSGADTIVNFDKLVDNIEVSNYANSAQQFEAAFGSTGADATHGDAVVNLSAGNSIIVAGVTEDYLQHHLNLVTLNGTILSS